VRAFECTFHGAFGIHIALSQPSKLAQCSAGTEKAKTRNGRLTDTISTPFAARACAFSLEGSLVMPRILNSFAVRGSARTDWMTEPPWFPVAPKTTRSLDGLDILVALNVNSKVSESFVCSRVGNTRCSEKNWISMSYRLEKWSAFALPLRERKMLYIYQ